MTEQHTTARRRDDALRDALAARRTDAEEVRSVLTRPQLEALAPWVHIYTRNLMAEGAVEEAARFRVLETLIRDAAAYGYPRPPLEQLGAQAGHLPAARSSDPATSHEAAVEVSGRPSTRNQLGRLLMAFRDGETALELIESDVRSTMTSEEAARYAGISLSSEFAKRCSDLTLLGYIRVAQDADGHDRTRKGAAGLQRLVFELTEDGRRLADDLIVRKG